jgi:predicted short-subunit dehydrogenase-like oxidoreductase (DUF2520 family)
MKKPSVTIIGLGKVGTALLNVLSSNSYRITSVVQKGSVSESVKTSYPDTIFIDKIPDSPDDYGDLILITVPDAVIEDVVKEMDSALDSLNSKAVAHCSGTYSSDLLKPLSSKGAKTGTFHPNRSITESTENFQNTWFDVEGDKDIIQIFKQIADSLGAKIIEIEAHQKPYLHASAVIASNYLVVLASLMTRVSGKAGLNEDVSLKTLIPLMRNTLDNIEQKGVSDALTGPIARGDVNTVRDHLDLLSREPDLKALYKSLGREALKVSSLKESDVKSYQELLEILSQSSKK